MKEDAIRAAITEQCIRKEPTAAVSVYSQQLWQENFERPWVIPNEKYLRTSTEVDGSGGHIYCRMCVKPQRHGKLLAFKLHVTIENDPMGVNKHGIITLECHGCGFEQIVPRKPRIKNAIFDEARVIQQSQKQKQPAWSFPVTAFGQQREFLNHIHELRQRGLIDEKGFQEYIARYEEEARQRVEALSVASPFPSKWPAP